MHTAETRPTRTTEDEQADHVSSSSSSLFLQVGKFKSTEGLRDGLFVASTSVLISAIVLALSTEGLTVYHGLVTLNLAQLNGLSSLMIRLLLLDYSNLKNTLWNTWVIDLAPRVGTSLPGPRDSFKLLVDIMSVIVKSFARLQFELTMAREAGLHFAIHTSLAGGFGLWFWSEQSRFERYAGESECVAQTMYWFFVPLHSHNKHIRRFFLVHNSLLVFPFTAPLALLLLSLVTSPISFLLLLVIILKNPNSIAGTVSLMVLYSFPMVFYIYSTEQTVRLNVLEDRDEGNWSYGQTLALVTASMSVIMVGSDIEKLLAEKYPGFRRWIKRLYEGSMQRIRNNP
ncbi:hypothetical protein VNI00_006625 [Paramarasmius palmivorus]|uniref:Uncharacterized protein n=1 Tax=Paramarasmius palmivorus TaxID=297713 RepID=A0AAW0D7H6_9AGAR